MGLCFWGSHGSKALALRSPRPGEMDADPPGSRLFIVCGKACEASTLSAAFAPFGNLTSVRIIRDKGVAYVKFDKASSAALAMEHLNGAVLNDGRGPKLKVLLAESPNTSTTRALNPPQSRPMEQPELSSDPDNIPPRSRLFLVVPKQADPQQLNDAMAAYDGLEYCKTDLVAAKGVVFCKFTKASAALQALEDVTVRGTVASYKVKCMLAEPKTKRGRSDGSPQEMQAFSPMMQAAKLDYGIGHHLSTDPHTHMPLELPVGHALSPSPMPDYTASALNSLTGLGGLGSFNHLGDVSASNLAANMQSHLTAAQVNALGFNPAAVGLGSLHANSSAGHMTPDTSPTLCKQRLFIVVHKSVTEDNLARLFRRFDGMEYCDLKKDRLTGKSKGYAYINYATPVSAAQAITQLHGKEYPPHSGTRIKVMYAEQLGARLHSANGARLSDPHSHAHSSVHSHAQYHPHTHPAMPHSAGSHSPVAMSLHAASPSPVHTPISRATLSPEVASVQESLANMSMPRVASTGTNTVDELEAARRMASPISTVARELMFNVA